MTNQQTRDGGLVDWQMRALLFVLTGGAVLAGVYFRFKGLDKSPFAIDEYYIATSVKSILEHGLPRLECGGFYIRGILLQYLVSPLFLTGLSHEFAFRLVTVLANLAALPAIYLLARHLAGAVAGCVAVALFSLSVWEVEFARFARMYAPFGTLFLWHLYFTYRNVILGDTRAVWWMYPLSLVAIFVSEFAIFPVLLNFLAPVMGRVRRPVVAVAIPALLLLTTFLLEFINFRRLGAGDYLPSDLMAEAVGGTLLPLFTPTVLLFQTNPGSGWLLLYLLPLAIALAAGVLWLRRAARSGGGAGVRMLTLLPLALLALGLLNLFGLVIYTLIISLLLSGPTAARLRALASDHLVAWTAGSLVLSLVYWVVFLALTDVWVQLGRSTGSPLKDAVLLLFGYPDVYWQVIVQWLDAMPLQTALMAVLVTVGCAVALRGHAAIDRGYRFLTALVLGMCLVVAALLQLYSTTRYTYFLYPVVLVLTAAVLVQLSRHPFRDARVGGVAAVGLTACVMLVSEDFDMRHLTRIDSDQVTYRMDYDPGRRDQYYQRWDFLGAADLVNAARREGDIVISTEYSVPYYLHRMDYLYMDEHDGRFWGISACGGTRDIWEGASLLRSADSVLKRIGEAEGTVWLIARSERYPYRSAGESTVSSLLEPFRVYRTVDGHLDVYRIIPGQVVLPDSLPKGWMEEAATESPVGEGP